MALFFRSKKDEQALEISRLKEDLASRRSHDFNKIKSREWAVEFLGAPFKVDEVEAIAEFIECGNPHLRRRLVEKFWAYYNDIQAMYDILSYIETGNKKYVKNLKNTQVDTFI